MRSDHMAMGRGPGAAQSWSQARERPLQQHSKMPAAATTTATIAAAADASAAVGTTGAAPPSNSLFPHAALSPGASESDHTDVRASPDGTRGAGSGKSVAAAMQAQGERVFFL
jgi:hypothetical protein